MSEIMDRLLRLTKDLGTEDIILDRRDALMEIGRLSDALFRIIDIAEGDGTSRAQPRIADIARDALGVPLR